MSLAQTLDHITRIAEVKYPAPIFPKFPTRTP